MPTVIFTAADSSFARINILEPAARIARMGHTVRVCIPTPASPSDCSAFPGLSLDRVNCSLSLNPFVFMRRLLALIRYFLHIKPEVVHSNTTLGSILPLTAAWLCRVPLRIYHNHGITYLGYTGFLRGIFRSIEAINIGMAHSCLIVSRSNLARIWQDGLDAKRKFSVIAHGSASGIDLPNVKARIREQDLHRAHARQKFGLPIQTIVVGYVGRPVKRKGFIDLLLSWQRLQPKVNEATLLIAGCSHAQCERSVSKLPFETIKALGYISNMQEFYDACDIICLPSYHEGFPNALLEGSAYGKALIGTNITGIDEIIRDGYNGVLVPAGDTKALAEAIWELLSDASKRTLFAARGREFAEKFDRDVYLAAFEDYYRSLPMRGQDRAQNPNVAIMDEGNFAP